MRTTTSVFIPNMTGKFSDLIIIVVLVSISNVGDINYNDAYIYHHNSFYYKKY